MARLVAVMNFPPVEIGVRIPLPVHHERHPPHDALRVNASLDGGNLLEGRVETIDQITGNNPRLAWADWKDAFRRSRRTAIASESPYYETYLYPEFSGDVPAENWMELTMDSDEVAELTASAN